MTRNEAIDTVLLLRRQLLAARLTNYALLTLLVASVALAAWARTPVQRADALWSTATLVGLAWLMLTVLSARQVRAAHQAAAFMASGRLDLAEERLRHAIGQFSLHRRGKLLVCHNLAVIAHGRRDFAVAAELCSGVISLRGGSTGTLARVCRILLADCRLALGDSESAGQALGQLSLSAPGLSLSEQLLLLPIELSCQLADGRYAAACKDLPWKVRLAELLEAPKAALAHALMARACDRGGEADRSAFLRRRAELYHDLSELKDEYPILAG